MKQLKYTVRFVTPAFLGNAEQSAQWRTPPFKALLRQWWRVAYAAENNFRVDVATMRREEGLLFGNAWLENAFRKSLVRLRLDRWTEGSLKQSQWPADDSINHPEVKNREGKPVPIGSGLYLGFGPLVYKRQRTTLKAKANAVIQPGESTTLSIAFPTTHKDAELKRLVEENASRIERALWLIDRYGTLGGRSRNGWGSFSLIPLPEGEGWSEVQKSTTRPWREALVLDWPHAIGLDNEGALVWQTSSFPDWKALIRELAIIKIGLRTQFKFPDEKPDGEIHDRHWISYPVTKHNVRNWDRHKLRLPNTLRFKVRPDMDDPKKLRGVIFHVPCKPTAEFNPDPDIRAIENVWKRVHAFLDAPERKLERRPE